MCFWILAAIFTVAFNQNPMIQHSVIFKLKHKKDSDEFLRFWEAAKKLENIPGVQKFKCLKQVSSKNNFQYGLSMKFDDQKIYDAYASHPDHVTFLEEFWAKDVEDFLEIDYKKLKV